MSGNVQLTIGGATGTNTGVISIPSALSFGALTTSGSLNELIQAYLGTLSQGFNSGEYDYESRDGNGQNKVIPGTASTVSGTFEQYVSVDSAGGAASGTGSYSSTVTSGVTDLLVELPGSVTLAGSSSTTSVLFGQNSDVTYSVTDAAAGTMFLAGGADSVTLYNTSGSTNETIYSAGTDTVNLQGQGSAYVTVLGNATVIDRDTNASVVASGSATTNLYWSSANAGGTLNFVNLGTGGATVNIGNFNGTTSSTRVTAYGGAGGGFFVGGAAGDNSLTGGTGVVTLVGAGNNDTLTANSNAGTNVFAQGEGIGELLIATSTTGSNIFGAGLQYPGLGEPSVSGVISTQGSGTQEFLLGNLGAGETIYGSTQSGALNNYFVTSNATAGGGQISIYNFIDDNSTIFLSNGAGGAGDASITAMGYDSFQSAYDIALSDGTNILLKGLSNDQQNAIHVATVFGITAIVG
jgi:hypothetical protein